MRPNPNNYVHLGLKTNFLYQKHLRTLENKYFNSKNQAQKNVQGFLDVFLALQHHGEFDAALDLSREAYSAACARRGFYKLNQRKFK